MIKQLLMLAASAVFSMNASAGYVQYNFSGQISGYVIQHDDDQSIAYYNFDVAIPGTPTETRDYPYTYHQNFNPDRRGEGGSYLSAPTTYFRNNGPANLVADDDFGADHSVHVNIDFSRTTQGDFAYKADFSAWIYFVPTSFSGSGSLSGLATKGTVNPRFAAYLDSLGGYYDNVHSGTPKYIGPAQVPEPASLALLGIGALGAAGVARRRKSRD